MIPDDAIHPAHEGDVQYPFADVGRSELMYIETLYAMKHRRREFSYTCPYCKKEMRPYLGEHNRHCFAHKPGQSCDRDKYIHTTAEQLLKERWDSDGPFEFTLTVEFVCEKADTCVFAGVVDGKCRRQAIHTINLKERYSTCLVEKKVGEFIPDLCLVDESGTNKPLFLEIWNTSRNSDKKNSSGYPIIVFRVQSMQDLVRLEEEPLRESDSVFVYGLDIAVPFGSCPDYMTRQQAQLLIKESWDESAVFEMKKYVYTECQNSATCPFDTYGRCRRCEKKPYDLKPLYSECAVDYEAGGLRHDAAFVDPSGKNPPILVDINKPYAHDTGFRTIRILSGCRESFAHILASKLEEDENAVIFSNFRVHTFVPDESSGTELVRYTLYLGRSGYPEPSLDDAFSCLNYKDRAWPSGAVFEIVGRKEDFPSEKEFIEFCNTTAARYNEAGICRRFYRGPLQEWRLFRPCSGFPWYCRFPGRNGVLTEQTHKAR